MPASRPLHRPLSASLLAIALAAALAAALPLYAAAAQAQEVSTKARRIDLPAGPLGHSLSRFASLRGIALSFDPALTAGLQAPALHGQFEDHEGLERLLAGSGLRLLLRTDGSYTLEKMRAADSGVISLPPLRIGAQRTFPYSEGIALDQDYIENTNKGNGDIATLLRINPAVQFSETGSSSRNMGDIHPANFSINGAPYYQNLFLLDGISYNNDIDPSADDPASFADVPSQSQGIAVDTDLLEKVTVYDSNIPASFGGFTGGVVDARTREAGDAFHGKIWYRMARSAWDQVLIPDIQQTAYAQSASHDYQSHYDKYKLGVQLEGRTRSGIGLIGTVTATRSEIPLRGYSQGYVSQTDSNSKTQTRENVAATLALDWSNGEGIELGANLVYAPTNERYFVQNAKDAWYDIKQGGPMLSLRAGMQHGAWTFTNTLSYSDLQSSRRSQERYWKSWAQSEAYDWGVDSYSYEGSFGNIDQHDRKIGFNAQADRETLDWGHSQHTLQFGLSYQHREADYERLNDQYTYYQPYATTSCTLSDGTEDTESCSLSPVTASINNNSFIAGQGQYFRRLTLYHAGRFKVSGDEWNAWMQDDIRVGNWSFRPGLRVDGDSIWDKTTLAPRLAMSWNVLGNGHTVLTAGANRYYGRNFFSYLLREGRERLQEIKTRTSSSTSWDSVTGTYNLSTNRISDLDIPHTDEWTIGLDQDWAGMAFNLKYVDRNNKDEVLRQYVRSEDSTDQYATRVYEYINSGRSRSQVYTFSVSNRDPLRWAGSSTQVQFAFDYINSHRNYSDYQTRWTDASDELVIYRGDPTWLYDLPATDYARKWTARLSTQSHLPLGPGELSWSNFLRYRDGFRDIVQTGSTDYEGSTLDVYGDVNYPRSLSYDTTLEYRLDLPRQQQTYARVEVTNVFNRANKISGTTSSSTYYEAGRSFWLELGYRF